MPRHIEEQLNLRFETTSYAPDVLALLTPRDIYDNCDEQLLKALKEDRRLDRKSAAIHSAELSEYIGCWSNTVGGGLVAIGQDDDASFSGCLKVPTQHINNLERAADTHCPEGRVVTRRIHVTRLDGGSDFVLLMLIEYHPSRVVRDVRGRVFVRIGDTKKEIKSPEEVRRMEIEKGQVDLEQEPVPLEFPTDFNMPLVQRYVHGVKAIKRLDKPHTDEEILVHGRLGRFQQGKFTPNVACALLFAADPCRLFPGCKIRIQRFDGETEQTGKNFNVVKDFFVEGPIPEVIVEAAKILKTQLREFTRLGEDGRFYTAPEYPEDAWYEALVNASVHRSYVLKTMMIFVKMFDDRLVVESPGGFPPPVTPETIYFTHSPRNPHLMQALFFMDFVKLSNEGTRRIRDTMTAMNLPRPEFAQKEVATGFDSVRVTLRNNVKLRRLWVDAKADERLGEIATQLEPHELRIVNYVAEHGAINVTQAQKLFPSNRRWQAVKKILKSMADRGILFHKHSPEVFRDAHAVYTLPPEPPEETKK